MHIGFLNPQGNFDPEDSYWAEHPDFGGQLVYVKQVALALGDLGHRVDILTRQIIDQDWPEFAAPGGEYPDAPNLRIIRLPAGSKNFLRKELLWPHLVNDWVPNILEYYQKEGNYPDIFTTHYGDGGLCGVLLEQQTRIPFSFTAHSLGAQKMDNLKICPNDLQEFDDYFFFRRRILAERLAMNRSIVNITSTDQERFGQYSHNLYRGAVDWTDNKHFAVIPPGVNLELFDRDARSKEEDTVYEFIEQKISRDIAGDRKALPCIVASSRLDPKKNHLGLVEAFASSPDLRLRSNLVILTGNLADPLNSLHGANKTEQQILESILEIVNDQHLRGQVAMFNIHGQRNLGAAYRYFARNKSVFALTAHFEPFGLAPLEAMAAGMPAVVTKCGGPSESLADGDQEFALLVDPRNLGEISTALYQLISDQGLWKHYAEAGYQRVRSKFNWKRTAEEYARVLGQVPQQRKSSGKKLPIHPYFLDSKAENDPTTASLISLYDDLDVLEVDEMLY